MHRNKPVVESISLAIEGWIEWQFDRFTRGTLLEDFAVSPFALEFMERHAYPPARAKFDFCLQEIKDGQQLTAGNASGGLPQSQVQHPSGPTQPLLVDRAVRPPPPLQSPPAQARVNTLTGATSTVSQDLAAPSPPSPAQAREQPPQAAMPPSTLLRDTIPTQLANMQGALEWVLDWPALYTPQEIILGGVGQCRQIHEESNRLLGPSLVFCCDSFCALFFLSVW